MGAGAIAIDFDDDLVAKSRETQSDDGTVTLKWVHPAGDGKVELQQARRPAFTDPVSRYSGAEAGSVITGHLHTRND